eukprot:1278277-Prymnesium_polylepis.1
MNGPRPGVRAIVSLSRSFSGLSLSERGSVAIGSRPAAGGSVHAPGRAFSRGVLCVPMRCLTGTVGSGVDSREAQVMTARVV